MEKLRIGIVQQHNSADINDNKNRLAQSIRNLAAEGAQLIVLQELHNSLYFCQTEDVRLFDLAEPIPGPSTDFFGRLAKELGVVVVTSLFERRATGLYHNTAVVIEKDGTIAGKYRKMHIPDDPAYYEKFYFTPGDLGFHPIETSVGRLGVLVCWDQWYPEAARLMALQGADLLIYPTAIGYDPADTPDEQERQRGAPGTPSCAVMPWPTDCPWWPSTAWASNPTRRNRPAASPSGEPRSSADRRAKSSTRPRRTTKRRQPSSTSISPAAEQVRRWWPFLRDRRIEEYGGITRRFIDETTE